VLNSPFIGIFGSQLGVNELSGAFLLVAILYAAWSYSEEARAFSEYT